MSATGTRQRCRRRQGVREPESQGERGEHQDASRNTDREISAFLQKHSTNRALNYCAVSHFDQVLQLEFNNWHLSCAHVHIYDICTCAQTCHGQTVEHIYVKLTRYWRGSATGGKCQGESSCKKAEERQSHPQLVPT